MIAVGVGALVLIVLGILSLFGVGTLDMPLGAWIIALGIGVIPAGILVYVLVEAIIGNSTKERRRVRRNGRKLEEAARMRW